MTTNLTLKACQQEVVRYEIGRITECDELSEEGGPLWQADIDLPGGYAIAATIYSGTEEAVRKMAEQAITAWNQRSIPDDEGTVGRVMIALFQCEWGKYKTITTEYERKFWSKRARAAIKAIGGM